MENKEKTLRNKQKNIEKLLNQTNKNYKQILKLSKDSENKKFGYLPYWRLKESKLLLRELKSNRTFFQKYKRGTIIKVDFGVNIGAEFSQVHYAIVLNKDDNRKNKTLKTTKDKKNTYNIGNVIFDNYIKTSKEHINDMCDEVAKSRKNGIEKLLQGRGEDNIKLLQKLNDLNEVVEFYSENPVCSFACYKNITTINKTRILPAINDLDFINKTVCSQEIMNKIDKKIIKHYTDIEYN